MVSNLNNESLILISDVKNWDLVKTLIKVTRLIKVSSEQSDVYASSNILQRLYNLLISVTINKDDASMKFYTMINTRLSLIREVLAMVHNLMMRLPYDKKTVANHIGEKQKIEHQPFTEMYDAATNIANLCFDQQTCKNLDPSTTIVIDLINFIYFVSDIMNKFFTLYKERTIVLEDANRRISMLLGHTKQYIACIYWIPIAVFSKKECEQYLMSQEEIQKTLIFTTETCVQYSEMFFSNGMLSLKDLAYEKTKEETKHRTEKMGGSVFGDFMGVAGIAIKRASKNVQNMITSAVSKMQPETTNSIYDKPVSQSLSPPNNPDKPISHVSQKQEIPSMPVLSKGELMCTEIIKSYTRFAEIFQHNFDLNMSIVADNIKKSKLLISKKLTVKDESAKMPELKESDLPNLSQALPNPKIYLTNKEVLIDDFRIKNYIAQLRSWLLLRSKYKESVLDVIKNDKSYEKYSDDMEVIIKYNRDNVPQIVVTYIKFLEPTEVHKFIKNIRPYFVIDQNDKSKILRIIKSEIIYRNNQVLRNIIDAETEIEMKIFHLLNYCLRHLPYNTANVVIKRVTDQLNIYFRNYNHVFGGHIKSQNIALIVIAIIIVCVLFFMYVSSHQEQVFQAVVRGGAQ